MLVTPLRQLPRIDYDSPQQEAYLQLWRTYDRLRAIEEALFAPFELSAQQYNALRLLQAAAPEGLRTLELGKLLISRAPDMTRLLDRLEQRGWIQRERLPQNRRVVEVVITPAGSKLLQDLQQPVRDCHEQQLGHLTPDELHAFIAGLKLAREPHESGGAAHT